MSALALTAALAGAAPARGPAAPAAPPAPAAPVAPAPDPRALPGWATYERYCLACHGFAGDGRGPAAPFTWGRPRAFATGAYAYRSTPSGAAPTADDLRLAIARGAPGTSMPAFAGILSAAQVDELLEVLAAFAPRPPLPAAPPVELGPPPPRDPARGAALYARLGCAACHGPGGRGDGPAAASLDPPPFDLTRAPLRRPRPADDAEARRRAAALDIATGLDGTAMPGFAGAVPPADLWALADHVVALGAGARRRDRSALDAAELAADQRRRLPSGTWPGGGAPGEEAPFGGTIRLQGPAGPALAPAEASLDAAQCARCHAKQVREWSTSLHRRAASPGLLAQVDHGFTGADVESCQRCHAPLAEQQPVLRPGQRGGDEADRAYAPNPAFSPELRAEGVSCAGCHVRGLTRHGPPRRAPSLLPIPTYPLATLGLYERADFCLPCHQLPPRLAVAGKPLLNTYKEWLEGPYMPRGVQCQHCHMPNREHAFLGVHDPATFRQGIAVTAAARRGADGVVTVAVGVTNVGAGHYLPTTPTPAAWLVVELRDRAGRPIAGTRQADRIGRDVAYDGAWRERADTRIPPGQTHRLARGWTGGRVGEAAFARVTLEVHPDAYYEGFYAERLAGRLAPAQRALFEAALARGRAARYVAYERDVAVAAP